MTLVVAEYVRVAEFEPLNDGDRDVDGVIVTAAVPDAVAVSVIDVVPVEAAVRLVVARGDVEEVNVGVAVGVTVFVLVNVIVFVLDAADGVRVPVDVCVDVLVRVSVTAGEEEANNRRLPTLPTLHTT